jgi:hypothetical protein
MATIFMEPRTKEPHNEAELRSGRISAAAGNSIARTKMLGFPEDKLFG